MRDFLGGLTSGLAACFGVAALLLLLVAPMGGQVDSDLPDLTGIDGTANEICISDGDTATPQVGLCSALSSRIPAGSPGNNQVWKTDGSGRPGWRSDSVGSGGLSQNQVDARIATWARAANASRIPAAKLPTTIPLSQLPFWQGTQAEYDAIDTPDPNIVYLILESN